MKITESRLRQIIREEVRKSVLDGGAPEGTVHEFTYDELMKTFKFGEQNDDVMWFKGQLAHYKDDPKKKFWYDARSNLFTHNHPDAPGGADNWISVVKHPGVVDVMRYAMDKKNRKE